MPWTQSIWHTRSGASSSRPDVDELIPASNGVAPPRFALARPFLLPPARTRRNKQCAGRPRLLLSPNARPLEAQYRAQHGPVANVGQHFFLCCRILDSFSYFCVAGSAVSVSMPRVMYCTVTEHCTGRHRLHTVGSRGTVSSSCPQVDDAVHPMFIMVRRSPELDQAPAHVRPETGNGPDAPRRLRRHQTRVHATTTTRYTGARDGAPPGAACLPAHTHVTTTPHLATYGTRHAAGLAHLRATLVEVWLKQL